MNINDQQIFLMEEFKIPFFDPFCPEDWKDWYHYILYDPATKTRLLFNLCFNGRPKTGYITDTLFLTLPKGFANSNISDPAGLETFGFARNFEWHPGDLSVNPLKYDTTEISFSIYDKVTTLNVANKSAGIAFNIIGTPVATPVYIPELAPYGNGFIGWGVLPGMKMKGDIQIGNKKMLVDESWYCYHDRNFGRFFWGNIGWTWFVLNATDRNQGKWTYVLHQSNNNDYSHTGSPILFVYFQHKLKKVFLGPNVHIDIRIEKTDAIPPILPGAMASVFSDRSIFMPKTILVSAADGNDNIVLKMDVNTSSELIVPDSLNKQYTFLKELSGSANTTQVFNKKKTACTDGFFYAEIVH